MPRIAPIDAARADPDVQATLSAVKAKIGVVPNLFSTFAQSPAVLNGYARCIQASKRMRWDIDEDVIRGRRFEAGHKFLPDGLCLSDAFTTLSLDEKRFVSQIQGCTYANVFGLVERFINAKILELSRDHWLGDQVALEALVRFSDEELKHQALFREVLPDGYRFDVDLDAVARALLGKSTWAVLALTLDIELFTQLHYRESIDPDAELSELFKDVFLYHWREESQHGPSCRCGAILDELEWVRHDAVLTAEERDRAVDEFIELVAAVDGILQAQAKSDAGYFVGKCGRAVDQAEASAIEAAFLMAYRWQYIHSGAQHPHFGKVLSSLITESQGRRIQSALATLH